MKYVSIIILGLLLFGLAGCGGGGNHASNVGRATVSITWPAVSRLIPLATDNVTVVITKGTVELAKKVINRPAQGGVASAVFTDLPVGSVTLTAQALPDPGATPNGFALPLAQATRIVQIASGSNTPVELTMASTIDQITIFPINTSLFPGASIQLMPQASGFPTSQQILLSPTRLTWTSSAPGIVGVDALGVATAISAGSAEITVTDTESGKSGKVTVTVSAGSTAGPTDPRFVNLAANDLVFEPVSAKLYASVPASVGGTLGNSVVAIDPVTQNVSAPIPMGVEPRRLAVSDDGKYLYVALNSTGTIARVDLKTMSVGLRFKLPTDSFFGQFYAEDIKVMPGSSQTVAVALASPAYSQVHGGIVIYDDGVARPTSTLGLHYNGNSIAFGAAPSRLYGYSPYGSPMQLSRYNIGPNGITLQDTVSNGILVGSNGSHLGQIVFSAGRLYLSDGSVIDPEALTSIGLLSVGSTAPDPALNRVFVLDDQNLGPATLRVYDAGSLSQSAGMAYTGTTYQDGFVRWGPKGIAWITKSGKIALVTVVPGT